jgi:hypothetical protein
MDGWAPFASTKWDMQKNFIPDTGDKRDCLMRQIKKILTKMFRTGTRLVFKFFRGSDDFILKKVYSLRLMPVSVGLIMLAAYFCHSF